MSTSGSQNASARRRKINKKKRRMRVIRNRIILAVILILIVVLIIVLAKSCHKEAEPEETATTSETGQSEDAIEAETQVRFIEGTTISYDDLDLKDTDTLTVDNGTAYVRSQVEISDETVTPSDDTAYDIRVNLAHDCVTVYRLDDTGAKTPVRAFACSSARGAHETPQGDYYLDEWYDWCYLADGTYGQYAYRLIMGDITDIMFHSVPYLEMSKNTLEWGDYDKLGDHASLGCIRMRVSDVRWLCENVGSGVNVTVYSDPSSPGPLGKPDTFFIPWDADTISGWDPSDPDPDNPWHDYRLSLTAEDQITVPSGSGKLDLTPYITATDSYGNDLAKYATYSFSGRQYGFTYTIVDQEDVPSYPEYTQSDMVSYGYNGMELNMPGTYNIVICVSSGPVNAYRGMQVIVE